MARRYISRPVMRCLIGGDSEPPPFHLKGSLKDNFQAAFAVIRYNTPPFYQPILPYSDTAEERFGCAKMPFQAALI